MRTILLILSLLTFALCGCHLHYGALPVAEEPVAAPLVREHLQITAAQIQVLEANLANVETVAFKRQRNEVLATQGTVALTNADQDVTLEVFVDHPILKLRRDFSQGALEKTGRSLDIGINGRGFFQVMRNDGSVGFTRDGRLQLNKIGRLVDCQGNVVTPEVALPEDLLDVWITRRGRITGRTASTPDVKSNFGQLQIARFMTPEALEVERGLYRITEASGSPVFARPGDQGTGMLHQGFLERSNVDARTARIDLARLRRNYRRLEQRLLAH